MKIPLIKEYPKECPWCHKIPSIEKVPLWDGSHGYHGKYKYYVVCKNAKCKIQPRTKEYNDIYDMSEEQCVNKAIEDWNNR